MEEEYNIDNLISKVDKTVEKFIARICQKIRTDADTILKDSKGFATGDERKAIVSYVERRAAEIVGVVGVRADIRYAIFHHEGTKPHFPPVCEIQKWVIQKGIVKMGAEGKQKATTMSKVWGGIFHEKGGKVKQRAIDTYNKSRSIAFLIARKISKSGTAGIPYLRMALNQNIKTIEEEVRNLKLV